MTRVMFMSEAAQVSVDALQRVKGILKAPIIEPVSEGKMPVDASIVFDRVSFAYEGADRNALEEVTFSVPSGSTVAWWGNQVAESLVQQRWFHAFGMSCGEACLLAE